MTRVTSGSGKKVDPWLLQTPPGSSALQVLKNEAADPPRLVVQVGTTQLSYPLRVIADCHAMLAARSDWVVLGSADEGKPCPEGSVEACPRDPGNPVGGCYGLCKGYRGRFANDVMPVMEMLGLVELDHGPRNDRVKVR